MNERIREVLEYLDARRQELERAVDAVPAELRERRPGPDRWSVAEVLEHLSRVEGRIERLLQGLIGSARERGLGPERDSDPVLPTVDVSRLLDRGRRVSAGEASLPRGGLNAAAAREAFRRQADSLRTVFLSGDGLALSEVVAPNPVLGPLNVYQWMIFVAGHEARHTLQIREIADTLSAAA